MRLIRLLLLGAGAAYAYKRFVTDARAGSAETAAAEPFSSEELPDPPAPAPAQQAPAEAEQEQRDTLERPTWLDPADA
jgi:hypothetical protein